jgi:hypothetical protein
MGIIQRLRARAFQNRLQKGLKQRKAPSGKSKVNLDNARHIGILFDATSVDERNQISKYKEQLRKQGKQLSLLGFIQDQVELDSLSFPAYNKKNLDWAGCPKGEKVDEFMKQGFDLLMNINLAPSPHENYISALSNAKLRVGPSTEATDCYDLMIGVKQSDGLQQFIKQMEKLLGKTNTTNEAA